MKILLIGNPYFKASLEKQGNAVTSCRGINAEKLDVSRVAADLIIVHESLGMREVPYGIEKATVPTVFYSIDVHLNSYWHREYAQLFDYVFVSQKDYVDKLGHENAHWLPWSIDPKIFNDHNRERIHDIAFVGTLDDQRKKRKNIISELKKRFRVTVFGSNPGTRLSHGEIAHVYSSTKIILNESIYGEVTFRTFEALACGGMLLTEKVGNGLLDLFCDGEEIVTYDYHNFIEKADYYLHNTEKRRKIAENGKQKVFENHTVDKSVQKIFNVLESNNFSKRDMSRNKILRHYGKTLFFTGMKFPRFQEKRLLRAEHIFKRLHNESSADVETAVLWSLIYVIQDNFQKARTVLLPYNDMAEKNELLSIVFGLLELEAGNREAAGKYFQNIIDETNVGSNNLFHGLGKIFEKSRLHQCIGFVNITGIPLNALECYNALPVEEAAAGSGNINFNLGLFDAAAVFYAKAAKLSPFDRTIKRKLGFSLLYSYKNHTAIDVLKNVLTLKDVDKNGEMTVKNKNLLKGAIYARRKQYDEAIQMFLCDDGDEAYLRLAHAYLEVDDIQKALFYCEKACRKRKYDFSTHKLLAMFYSRNGILTDAYALMRKSQNIEEERKAS